jgi:arylsulfatase A-like enzyme
MDTFNADQRMHHFHAGDYEPTETEWENLRKLYRAGVAHADHLLGRIVDRLDDDTWLFVTADHGDHLGEYDRLAHRFSLYDELINVPLLVAHPSLPDEQRDHLVSHVDLVPTMCDALDREGREVDRSAVADLPGRSLLAEPAESDDRVVFAEYGPGAAHVNSMLNECGEVPEAVADDLFRGIQAAITPEFKLLRYSDGERRLVRHGEEATDLSGEHSEVADQLATRLDEELDDPTDFEFDRREAYVREDVADQLADLGYL